MRGSLERMAQCMLISALSLYWLPDGLLFTLPASCLTIAIVSVLYLASQTCTASWITHSLHILLCLMICLGYTHYQARQLLAQADAIVHLPKKIHTRFKIVEVIHQHPMQTYIASAQLDANQPEQRLYLHASLPQPLQRGEVWQGELTLKPLAARLNDGGMDRQRWYFAQRITARASVKRAVKIQQALTWRDQWIQTVSKQTDGLTYQGLLMALAFGERAGLAQPLLQIYQKTNTAHLLAISGLHIGLAMSLGYGLMRLLQLILPLRWITPGLPQMAGILLALSYAYLAGFSIPTTRACLALCLVIACRMSRYHYTVWQLWQIVIATLLLLDPLNVLSLSFWLSVSAVTILIIWYQIFPLTLIQWRGNPLQASPWRRVYSLIALLHAQLGLLWLLTPIQLGLFTGLSIGSVMANLVAVPFYTVLLVPIILFAVFSQGAFASWQIADNLVHDITLFLRILQPLWWSLSAQQSVLISTIFALLLLAAIWYVYRSKQQTQHTLLLPDTIKKQTRGFHLIANPTLPRTLQMSLYFGLTGFIFISWLTIIYSNRHTSDWRLTTLDVGQGLSVLISKNGRGVLYDTGAAWRHGSMAQSEILPYLQRQGIQLDYLIISHDDNDHAGGAKTILQHAPDIHLITASTQNYGKKDRTFCLAGKQWQWQGLTFRVLAPQKITKRAKNTDSCVLLLSDGKYHVLLTGDADIASEKRFASQLNKIDVLQVGHHGSKTSTGHRLLRQTHPDIALISSARWNPWHFPHPTVTARLAHYHSQIYHTAEAGQITLTFTPSHIQVHTARTEFSPWYRRLIGLETK
ncbi:DNA internalization-related competence protein ComEC/Rec2 [Pasteurella sp. P03HT]